MGYLISFEGGEGSGKSTILKQLAEYLIQQGYSVVCTREPGGIEIAEQIRNVILDKKNVNMDAKTEALLYAAARRQHLVEKIIPELEKERLYYATATLIVALLIRDMQEDWGSKKYIPSINLLSVIFALI